MTDLRKSAPIVEMKRTSQPTGILNALRKYFEEMESSGDTAFDAGYKQAGEFCILQIKTALGVPTGAVLSKSAEAQIRLDEFLLIKRERPSDPVYWDVQHEDELRAALEAQDGPAELPPSVGMDKPPFALPLKMSPAEPLEILDANDFPILRGDRKDYVALIALANHSAPTDSGRELALIKRMVKFLEQDKMESFVYVAARDWLKEAREFLAAKPGGTTE